MTALQPLTCPKCRAVLLGGLGPLGTSRPCPGCRALVEGSAFPASLQPVASGKQAEALVTSEDAGCFYHPNSRAQAPCDMCGRFLCALCDIEVQGEHYCPACMNSGRRKKQIRSLDGDRMLYGGLTLVIALVPLIALFPVTIITGPLSLVVAAIGWKKPKSLVGHGRISYVFGILFGLLETVGWALLIGALLFGVFSQK